MDGFSTTLVEELIALRVNTPKRIVFCQTLKQCGDFYHNIKRLLGQLITNPPGVPAVVPFRIFGLFTSALRVEMRAQTLEEFCKPNSTLWLRGGLPLHKMRHQLARIRQGRKEWQ